MNRVGEFAKRHWTILLVVAIFAWVIYRRGTGRNVLGAGHATPADAIAYGWAVSHAGITGWLEVSPDNSQSIMHDTGWTSDPYTTEG